MHRTPTSLGTGLAYVPLCWLRTREPITRLTQQQPKHFVVTSYSLLSYSIKLRTHDPNTEYITAVNVPPFKKIFLANLVLVACFYLVTFCRVN